MEYYFALGQDNVPSIVSSYVRLALIVRLKLDEISAIEKLEKSLYALKILYPESSDKFKDLSTLIIETLVKLKD